MNSLILKFIFTLILVSVVLTAVSSAQTLVYVDPNAPGANNGTSWQDAYLELRDALTVAVADTTLRVADGTYSPGSRPTKTFKLKNGVTLEGGYAGYGAPDPDLRDVQVYESVLDGNNLNYHVVTGSGTDATAVLDGFTVTRGNANGSQDYENGGGMINLQGYPTVIQCSFIDNHAINAGGGMYNWLSGPSLSNCTFQSNIADRAGGMGNFTCTTNLNNCLFSHNVAMDHDGGAMINSSQTVEVTLTGCTFVENSCHLFGGAIFNEVAKVSIDQCVFKDNVSHNSGGGVYNQGGSWLTYTDCTFDNNSAEFSGGGMVNFQNYTNMTNCTFTDNSALNDGGGMYNVYYKGTVQDCTFNANSGDIGGGVYDASNNTSSVWENCLFLQNLALTAGGGVYQGGASASFTGCSFEANTSPNGAGLYINSNAVLVRCAFDANLADVDGGGIYIFESNPTLEYCTFKSNEAGEGGGGLCNENATSSFSNCLFHHNTARIGGAMRTLSSIDPTLIHCTIADNTATDSGGGFHNENGFLVLINSLLWGNLPDDIENISPVDPTVKHSCLQTSHSGEGNIVGDPLFQDPANDDYRLSAFSPCINRASNAYGLVDDWEGDPRPHMGTVDMGMDEYTGVHTLAAGGFTLSRAAGDPVPFTLEAGAAHAGKFYVIIGSLSGHVPGFDLPGGQAVMPINFDGFTNNVLNRLNTPVYANFLTMLDGAGSSTAQMDFKPDGFPIGWVGKTMTFAYTVETFDMVSNPVSVEVIP